MTKGTAELAGAPPEDGPVEWTYLVHSVLPREKKLRRGPAAETASTAGFAAAVVHASLVIVNKMCISC
jgi:hypothetical protein